MNVGVPKSPRSIIRTYSSEVLWQVPVNFVTLTEKRSIFFGGKNERQLCEGSIRRIEKALGKMWRMERSKVKFMSSRT
jgi:hypothetical protein